MTTAAAGSNRIRDYTQMHLGDALYWLSHDERGLPRLRPRNLGLVLAAELLGELTYQQKIDLRHGQVVVTDRHPPREPVIHAVYEEILYTSEASTTYGLVD